MTLDLYEEVVSRSNLAMGETIVLLECDTFESGEEVGVSYRKFKV